ncbi:FAD-dependent oxidoreductase [Acidiphilium cryptum]|uniref:FAD-dependent pyridine nucleotide-disulfide oxidoreductase n=2 Tax=Acidiphilium TaxID=522 RepID=A5G1C4_ACICJ|nr:FAD-dependent oxidoreductase [Acidiphilium cryptum]ABQ31656.1 FAD-dependent pyridine nucleotide-disulfide oxidoreductase [Acidiphilium cryptum JF-5]
MPVRHLLLVGAGHASIEVLRSFALAPVAGLRLTVLTPSPALRYSGMLPGIVAGHTDPAAGTIDTAGLARAAGAALCVDRASFVDAGRRRVFRDGGDPVDYDLLVLDVGAPPATPDAPQALPVRPADELLARLAPLDEAAARPAPFRIAVVGGGAAGVELVFALETRLRARRAEAGADPATLSFVLLPGPFGLLPTLPAGVARQVRALFAARGIEVGPSGLAGAPKDGAIPLDDGSRIEADVSLWASGAAAPSWLRGGGLATDAKGFVAVAPTLRSISHENVFAAGDIAGFGGMKVPKSGLYAVRQGPVLAENLRRHVDGRPLRPFRPQRAALYLLATGPDHAIGTRNGIVFSGAWVRRWKDRIDRRFIARFSTP